MATPFLLPHIYKKEARLFILFSDYLLQFRWSILPLLNPDGYVYTFTTDRFWSKNRRPPLPGVTKCFGVNLNRNFPVYFGIGPNDSCDRAYVGPSIISEPEVQAVIKYSKDFLIGKSILVWTLHSYGQVFFLPYAGDKTRRPRNSIMGHDLYKKRGRPAYLIQVSHREMLIFRRRKKTQSNSCLLITWSYFLFLFTQNNDLKRKFKDFFSIQRGTL